MIVNPAATVDIQAIVINIEPISLEAATMDGAKTLPTAMPIGLDTEATVLASARSDSPNQYAANTVGESKITGCAIAHSTCPTNMAEYF